jgi:hypothetical protein
MLLVCGRVPPHRGISCGRKGKFWFVDILSPGKASLVAIPVFRERDDHAHQEPLSTFGSHQDM